MAVLQTPSWQPPGDAAPKRSSSRPESGQLSKMGFTILARNGTLVLVGMPPSGVTAHLDPGALAGAGQRIIGCKMGSTVLPRDLPALFRHYLEGRLKLDELITGRYPFRDINAALDAARRGEGLRNVLIF